MGLFDDEDRGSGKDEVRIDVPNKGGDDARLKDDVETRLADGTESRTSSRSTSVDLEDLYEQNERIIELLEKAVNENKLRDRSSGSSRVTDRDDSSSRVTDRGSSGSSRDSSSRVTDRKNRNDSDDDGIGDGMNELL